MKPLTSTLAPMAAAKMPAAVRSRLRSTFRSTIRQPELSERHSQPMRSSRMAPPRRGGLGRMASAGRSRSTARLPRRLPNAAQPTLTSVPTAETPH